MSLVAIALALTFRRPLQIGPAMRTLVSLVITGAIGLTALPAGAVFLDKGRNFDVRFRGYSQVNVAAENSRDQYPDISAGNLLLQRNFYNPEFDAKLTDYMSWMKNVPVLSLLAPDDFKFRFAWWGFYDGIFDYADEQWNDARKGTDLNPTQLAAYSRICRAAGCNPRFGPKARQAESDNVRRESFRFNDQYKDLRSILGRRNRINELYIDYTNGPVFVRVGRQTISWGESDSIAQLDVSNPFDLTQGAPGFFQDVDEARIPLWTLRTTVKLLDTWKEISSVFLDTYLVPGIIDTTVPITPSWFGQPYSPSAYDPQVDVSTNPLTANLPIHTTIVDRLPKQEWSNSRWGVRLTGVVARDFTVQSWFFRTFPIQPAPQLLGPSAVESLLGDKNGNPHPERLVRIDNLGRKTGVCLNAAGQPLRRSSAGQVGHTPGGRACKWAAPIVTQLTRRLTDVYGVAATWFSEPVNGIIRTEAEFFHNEPGVIPDRNLNAGVQVPFAIGNPLGLPTSNSVPVADILRWSIGYDTFFFMRALNPSNSFTFSGQYQGAFNFSESSRNDFRSPVVKPGNGTPGKANACTGAGQPHPSCRTQGAAVPNNFFEDVHQYEGFFTLHIETDYMHGTLKPAITAILDPSGIFGFDVGAQYRINDNLIASAKFLAVEGSRRTGLGNFRDRDTLLFRLTYQLN
jgi:Protein of unknown function (DUF1302)